MQFWKTIPEKKKITNVDKKIINTTELIGKSDYSFRITEIRNKIPSINELVIENYKN